MHLFNKDLKSFENHSDKTEVAVDEAKGKPWVKSVEPTELLKQVVLTFYLPATMS